MKKLTLACSGPLLLTLCATTAPAGDIDDEPFALRVEFALNRVSAFTDTLGRSASAAHPRGSSRNPGANDVQRQPPFDYNYLATIGTNHFFFDSGAWFTTTATHHSIRPDHLGTFALTYANTQTLSVDGRNSQSFDLRSDDLRLTYSKSLDPDLTLGAELYYFNSNLDLRSSPVNAVTEREGLAVLLGAHYRLAENLRAGAWIDVGWIDVEVEGETAFGLSFRDDHHVNRRTFTTGILFNATENASLLIDGQYIHFDSDEGAADAARSLIGLEIIPFPNTEFTPGLIVDSDGHLTPTVGLSFLLTDRIPVTFAYGYNVFPEVDSELGDGQLLSLSVIIPF